MGPEGKTSLLNDKAINHGGYCRDLNPPPPPEEEEGEKASS